MRPAYRLKRAITARMIMNNVLSRVNEIGWEGTPYLIWYPSIAAESTYRELFRLRPSMAPQILRACIAGEYITLFNNVIATVEPDRAVVRDAETAGGVFKEAVERRVREVGGTVKPLELHEGWQIRTTRELQSTSKWIPETLNKHAVGTGFELLYDGVQCDASVVEMLASMPEGWRMPPDDIDLRELDYEEWPPKMTKVEEP
jgi:hypothetical protein